MAFKFVVLSALVASAHCGLLPVAPIAYAAAAPIAKSIVTRVTNADYDPHPRYVYSYDVGDALTGDFKAQTESRDGDVVRGSYSLLEADGTRRVVDYTADSINGFNAYVRNEPATFVKAAHVVAAAAEPAPIAKLTPVAPVAPVAAAAVPVAAAPAAHIAYPAAAPADSTFYAPVPSYARIGYRSPFAYAAPLPAAYSLPTYYRSFY